MVGRSIPPELDHNKGPKPSVEELPASRACCCGTRFAAEYGTDLERLRRLHAAIGELFEESATGALH